MKTRHIVYGVGAALMAALLPACSTTPTQKGALIGGALGAGTGAIIGNQSGERDKGALIGAAAGALTGALVGDQVDERRSKPQPQQQEVVLQQQAAPATTVHAPAVQKGGHYETRIVRSQSGETYEERVWVPDK